MWIRPKSERFLMVKKGRFQGKVNFKFVNEFFALVRQISGIKDIKFGGAKKHTIKCPNTKTT